MGLRVPWQTALVVAVITVAAGLLAAGMAIVAGGTLYSDHLWWRSVVQVSLVMGSLGSVVVALSFLSPAIQTPAGREYWRSNFEPVRPEARSAPIAHGGKSRAQAPARKGSWRAVTGKATH
jgi:hypothetical protein